MSDTRHEFCSVGWVKAARVYVESVAGEADLTGVTGSFNEVFTDAPAHLGPDDQGRVGWYLRVIDGVVEVATGVLPAADFRITADYSTIVPLARMTFEGNPELAAEAGKIVAAATRDGRMRRDGDEKFVTQLPWLAGLHDAMAKLTA